MNHLNWLTIGFLFISLCACTPSNSKKVRQDLNLSLSDNQNARNIVEWESSGNTPELIFKKWKELQYDSKDICDELLKKDGKNIAFFEEEIKDPVNESLVAPCKEQLLKKIELYWAEQRTKIFAPPPGTTIHDTETFQFPDNEQIRDTHDGYQAVTGDVQNKEIILTFDDGPHPQYTEIVLAALAKVNAKALFFSLGKRAVEFPNILKKVGQGGHSVGSHSMDHMCLAAKPICGTHNGHMMTLDEAIKDIADGHQAVEQALGWVDPFFRFPYGETSPELNAYLKSRGIGAFFWNIDSEDWKNKDPDEMIATTLHQLDKLGRGLIIFHDVQRKTAEALPALLKQFYFRGYSVVLIKPETDPALAPSPTPVL